MFAIVEHEEVRRGRDRRHEPLERQLGLLCQRRGGHAQYLGVVVGVGQRHDDDLIELWFDLIDQLGCQRRLSDAARTDQGYQP